MRIVAWKLVVACASATFAMAVFAAPAQAAENLFTPAEACNNDFGGTWAHVTDGHRSILKETPKERNLLGDVYLMYDRSSGKNCVVTIKRVLVGGETSTAATLRIRGGAELADNGRFKYYAAVQGAARDTCVAYRGSMYFEGASFSAGRDTWGNCA